MNFRSCFEVAFKSLGKNRMRTALSMVGMTIGVATVLTDAPTLRKVAVAWMLTTGGLMLVTISGHIFASTSFRVKLALLAALIFVRKPRWLVLTLWVAVIFASRGIAYF